MSEHLYNAFGDLFQTILPRGNAVEYGYAGVGRLVTIERKPDAAPASRGERTLYELDAFGHRVREQQQSWENPRSPRSPAPRPSFTTSTAS